MRGTGRLEGDAPLVVDVLQQAGDLMTILESVEKASATDKPGKLVWRLTKLSMHSPCSFEVTPDPDPERAAAVVRAVASGLQKFAADDVAASEFPAEAREAVKRVYTRTINGLCETTINFRAYGELPTFVADSSNAHNSIRAIESVPKDESDGYVESTWVEGYVYAVERDRNENRIVRIRSRLRNELVKCTLPGDTFDGIGDHSIESVVSGRRIRAYGMVAFSPDHRIKHVAVDHIDILDLDNEKLPTLEDLITPGLLGGRDAVSVIRELRDHDA